MKTWKHMSEDNRKTICSCISHNKKLIEISETIGYDPRLKEIESLLIMPIKLKVNVLNLIDGLMYVLIVKIDTKIALL